MTKPLRPDYEEFTLLSYTDDDFFTKTESHNDVFFKDHTPYLIHGEVYAST